MNKIIKNNIYFKLKQENKYCCGCTSCINKCIHDAITMKIDKKGFLYASIEDSKCINCGLCIQVCPEINIKNNNVRNPIKYAFKASEDIVNKSSSGGAFTVLALHILNNNGVVVGAAYTNNFDVNHIIIDSIDDLYKLRLSKYIQRRSKNYSGEY